MLHLYIYKVCDILYNIYIKVYINFSSKCMLNKSWKDPFKQPQRAGLMGYGQRYGQGSFVYSSMHFTLKTQHTCSHTWLTHSTSKVYDSLKFQVQYSCFSPLTSHVPNEQKNRGQSAEKLRLFQVRILA